MKEEKRKEMKYTALMHSLHVSVVFSVLMKVMKQKHMKEELP